MFVGTYMRVSAPSSTLHRVPEAVWARLLSHRHSPTQHAQMLLFCILLAKWVYTALSLSIMVICYE